MRRAFAPCNAVEQESPQYLPHTKWITRQLDSTNCLQLLEHYMDSTRDTNIPCHPSMEEISLHGQMYTAIYIHKLSHSLNRCWSRLQCQDAYMQRNLMRGTL
jgi:hypothetical protein